MKAFALSNIGKVRAHNEDAYYTPQGDERFAAVADGMGGHLAGEVASAMAIEVFTSKLREAKAPDEAAMRVAVQSANRAIYEASLADPTKRGMGTTLTALWFGDDCVCMSHVGDSRAYLLRNKALMQFTNDHSLVNEMVEKGELTPLEARNHPQRNIITRALGTSRHIVPDIIRLDWQPGDVWLLCSDGLSNYALSHELARVMLGPDAWVQKLGSMVEIALSRGGSDNITALVVTYGEEQP